MATTERGIRSYLDGEVELPTPNELVSLCAESPRRHGTDHLSLIACSRCLRVLRGEEWVDAETVIRELHSYEYEAPPHLAPVLCPICTLAIHVRRAQARVPLRRDMVRSRGRR
jgi:hypothetical protein